MKYVFRGHVVFEYIPDPNKKRGHVIQHQVHDTIAAFDYCEWIPEDYKLLAQFFDIVYRHINGEEIELNDIEVYWAFHPISVKREIKGTNTPTQSHASLAQLVERLPYMQDVGGSNPSGCTKSGRHTEKANVGIC